jgi:hypothetical protein
VYWAAIFVASVEKKSLGLLVRLNVSVWLRVVVVVAAVVQSFPRDPNRISLFPNKTNKRMRKQKQKTRDLKRIPAFFSSSPSALSPLIAFVPLLHFLTHSEDDDDGC